MNYVNNEKIESTYKYIDSFKLVDICISFIYLLIFYKEKEYV